MSNGNQMAKKSLHANLRNVWHAIWNEHAQLRAKWQCCVSRVGDGLVMTSLVRLTLSELDCSVCTRVEKERSVDHSHYLNPSYVVYIWIDLLHNFGFSFALPPIQYLTLQQFAKSQIDRPIYFYVCTTYSFWENLPTPTKVVSIQWFVSMKFIFKIELIHGKSLWIAECFILKQARMKAFRNWCCLVSFWKDIKTTIKRFLYEAFPNHVRNNHAFLSNHKPNENFSM
jgi:hypothetical protein